MNNELRQVIVVFIFMWIIVIIKNKKIIFCNLTKLKRIKEKLISQLQWIFINTVHFDNAVEFSKIECIS